MEELLKITKITNVLKYYGYQNDVKKSIFKLTAKTREFLIFWKYLKKTFKTGVLTNKHRLKKWNKWLSKMKKEDEEYIKNILAYISHPSLLSNSLPADGFGFSSGCIQSG